MKSRFPLSLIVSGVALPLASVSGLSATAAQGSSVSIYSAENDFKLAMMKYINENNIDEAYKYIRNAANQGYDKAQYLLGVCYMNGEGVTQDALRL